MKGLLLVYRQLGRPDVADVFRARKEKHPHPPHFFSRLSSHQVPMFTKEMRSFQFLVHGSSVVGAVLVLSLSLSRPFFFNR